MSRAARKLALIVGSRDDPHTSAVAGAVADSADVFVLDAAALQKAWFTVTPEETRIRLAVGDEMVLDRPARGWMRRVATAGWNSGVSIGSTEAAVKASWLALLSAVVRDERIHWLTDPTPAALFENKLLQYAAAGAHRRAGTTHRRDV